MVQPQVQVMRIEDSWRKDARLVRLRYGPVAGGECAWHPWFHVLPKRLLAARDFAKGDRIAVEGGPVATWIEVGRRPAAQGVNAEMTGNGVLVALAPIAAGTEISWK